MNTVLLIIVIIACAWIALMIGLKSFVALLRRQTEKAALNAIHPEEVLRITDNASYLGAGFPGPNLPLRTSGALILTAGRLFFLPWFPRKSITLPRNTIRTVKRSPSFNGQTYSIDVLVLSVKGVGNPDGEMAWLVHDPEVWEKEIKSILAREST